MGGSKANLWYLVLLCGLAFSLRVAGLEYQSLWRDEVDAIRFASEPLAQLLRGFNSPGQNGPLYYLLLHIWLDLAGRSEFSLRFPSMVCGVLAIPMLWRLGRSIFPDRRVLALVVSTVAVFSPYLVWYSQEGKMYSLVLLLALLSMERHLAAMRLGGTGRWLSWALSTGAAAYVHLVAVLLLPVQMLVAPLAAHSCRLTRTGDTGDGREAGLGCPTSAGFRDTNSCLAGDVDRTRRAQGNQRLFALGTLLLTLVPLLAWLVPMLMKPAETGFRFVPLPAMLLTLLVDYSQGVVWRVCWPFVALLFGILVAAGLLATCQPTYRRPVTILTCWLLVPVLGLYLVSLNRPVFTARYLIFVLPAFLLLLGAGLAAIWRSSRLLAALCLAVLLTGSVWGVVSQARTAVKADMRGATSYVAARLDRADLVLFQLPYARYTFEYYFERTKQDVSTHRMAGAGRVFLPIVGRRQGASFRWADGPYTNNSVSEEALAGQMERLTAGSQVIWLVATEVELWDGRDLVRGWLDRHARLDDAAYFVRVSVYRYEMP